MNEPAADLRDVVVSRQSQRTRAVEAPHDLLAKALATKCCPCL